MEVPAPVIGIVGGIVIAMAAYIWRVKSECEPERDRNTFAEWRHQHAETHRVLDSTLKDQSECLHKQKMTMHGLQQTCDERCRQEDKTFRSLEELIEKQARAIDEIRVANGSYITSLTRLETKMDILMERRRVGRDYAIPPNAGAEGGEL